MPRNVIYDNGRRQGQGDNRLEKLAALAQIYGGLTGQQNQAQQNQQQNALAVLGLILNQQNQQAGLGQRKSEFESEQQARAATLAETKRAHDLESGQYWQGDLPFKYAGQEAAQKEAEATRQLTAGHYKELADLQRAGLQQSGEQFTAQQNQEANKLQFLAIQDQRKMDAEKAAQQDALTRAGLTNYASIPGATLEGYSKLAESANIPGFAPFNAANKEALLTNNVSQLQGLLGPVYGQFDKSPHQAQSALDAIWKGDQRMQNPEVQARLQPYLQSLNEGLYKGPQAAATSVGGVPPPNIPTTLQPSIDQIQAQKLAFIAQEAVKRKAFEEDQKRQQALKYIDQNTRGMFQGGAFAGFR